MAKKRRQWKKKKNSRDLSRSSNPKELNYMKDELLARGNIKMEAYYAAQGLHDHSWKGGELVETEDWEAERKAWRECAASVLAASFRFSKLVSPQVRQQMEDELQALLQAMSEGAKDGDEEAKTVKEPLIQKLAFLPHAYQLTMDRFAIRKHENPGLHLWLKAQTECGHVTRQETVSMIPPVAMDVQPSDVVLDMCAAPGSKTSQILEELSGRDSLLVANDSNPQRANMLTSQLKRIWNVHPVVMITAADAQTLPGLIRYDKILADVPCSGDGTTRKNLGVWKEWTMHSALALSRLQLCIAWHGLEQLKVGGQMVYSTCSMNPIENEAVVAELIRKAGGNVEIVPIELEGFKTRPGMKTWSVFSEGKSKLEIKKERNKAAMRKRYDEFRKKELAAESGESAVEAAEEAKPEPPPEKSDTADDDGEKTAQDTKPPIFQPTEHSEEYLVEQARLAGLERYTDMSQVPELLQRRIHSFHFPPSEEFHLERCMRCLPHDNDTGGFFIALLRKTGTMSNRESRRTEESSPSSKRQRLDDNEEDDKSATPPTNDTSTEQPAKDKPKGRSRRNQKAHDDNFYVAKKEMLDPIVEYYGLTEDFPRDQMHTRGVDNTDARRIYYLSPTVTKVLQGLQTSVTLINTGIKAFSRNTVPDVEIKYRLSQEGLAWIGPFMTKRKLFVSQEDFTACLQDAEPHSALDEDVFTREFREKAHALSVGCFVIVWKGATGKPLYAVMWRCRGDNIQAHVSKIDMDSLRDKVKAQMG